MAFYQSLNSLSFLENDAWVRAYVCSMSKSSRLNCIFNIYVACVRSYKITKASILQPPGLMKSNCYSFTCSSLSLTPFLCLSLSYSQGEVAGLCIYVILFWLSFVLEKVERIFCLHIKDYRTRISWWKYFYSFKIALVFGARGADSTHRP